MRQLYWFIKSKLNINKLVSASFLLLGAFFWALEANAGIFSSLLGKEASADTFLAPVNKSIKNSQNMELLQANMSFSAISDDAKDKSDKKKDSKESEIDPNGSVNILSGNALLANAGPMTPISGIGGYDFSTDEDISIYVVHKGDTVQVVADLFDVSVDTVYSANDMKKGDKLKEGDVLLILPFSGIEHTVGKGDTLKGISNKYDVPLEYILSANDLGSDAKLVIGEKLMVPGGDMIPEKPKSSGSSASKLSKGGSSSSIPSVSGYFKNPVPGAKKTRGVKPGHKGVDMAAPTGTNIYAAAEGTVLIARSGYNGGFGTYVVIQHPNGVKTLYAHMSKLATTPGAKVSKGDLIGHIGSTGHSTGPHLHFETLGSKNPF